MNPRLIDYFNIAIEQHCENHVKTKDYGIRYKLENGVNDFTLIKDERWDNYTRDYNAFKNKLLKGCKLMSKEDKIHVVGNDEVSELYEKIRIENG